MAHDSDNILLQHMPRDLRLTPRRPPGHEVFVRNLLYHAIPCAPPVRCHRAVSMGVNFDNRVFLRRFPLEWLTEAVIERLKQQVMFYAAPGIEQYFDLGHHAEQGYLVSDLADGASLAQLQQALDARGQALSLGLALAIYREARAHLARLHAADWVHGRLRPTQIRLYLGHASAVFLCRAPHFDEPSCSQTTEVFELATHVFSLATVGPERDRVRGLLADGDPHGFAVLSDLIVEADPRLAEVTVEMLWPESGQPAPAAVDRVLAACVTPAEIRQLWRWVEEIARAL